MSMFSCFNCMSCCQPNHIDNCTIYTRLWPTKNRNDSESKLNKIFSKPQIRFHGYYDEVLKGKSIDLDLIDKSGIKKIAMGKAHTLFLFNDNRLGVWGSNEYGQLGLNLSQYLISDIATNELSFIKETTSSEFKIIDIECFDYVSFVLIEDQHNIRKLYRLGLYGSESLVSKKNLSNKNVIILMNFDYMSNNISRIKAKGDRLFIITSDNKIFLHGVDYEQNIFNDIAFFYDFKANEETNNKVILDIALGKNHCIILTKNKDSDDSSNEIFVMGSNDYGELGFNKKSFDKIIESKLKEDQEADIFLSINKPYIQEFFSNKSPIFICCGDRHNLVLCKNGHAYCFGDNSYGQCTEFENKVETPRLINYPYDSKSKILKVFSGSYHSALINEEGEVFTWGDTAFDKLGYSLSKLSQHTPRLMPYLKGFYVSYLGLFDEQTVVITNTKQNAIRNDV